MLPNLQMCQTGLQLNRYLTDAANQFDCNMRASLETSVPQAILDQPASGPPCPTLNLPLVLQFGVIPLVITSSRGVVTVRDVLERIQRELSKRADNLEVRRITQVQGGSVAAHSNALRRIDLLASNVFFGGLSVSSDGWFLIMRPSLQQRPF